MRRRIITSSGGNSTDYSTKYLTFVASESGTFQFSGTGISYSLDEGNTWTSLAADTATPTVAAGSSIMWKGTIKPGTSPPQGIGTFSSTGNFTAEGNPMCLLFGDEFEGETDLTGKNYAFYRLFYNCTKLTSINNLVLPATTLATYCYQYMFSNCSSLTSIPSGFLPATTLVAWCYQYMFQNCSSLTAAPELPATTLAGYCCNHMFSYCTSLTTVPSTLSATTLATYCYSYMFYGCTSLTTAPTLPATTLAQYCYQYMFSDCTSLTTAPILPAITLTRQCYAYMFNGCSSLSYIKAMFTTTPQTTTTTRQTYNWVKGVAASGTFVKNSAATWTTTGVNGVPSGWTVQTASS